MAEASFVTGGSGFIGGRLIERLVGEGRPVRALARSDASAAKVESLGAEAVRGDLGDRASLAAGAAGCASRLPPRREARRVGAVGGLRARQRRGHPQRARGLRRGGRAAIRPLRHRGGADGRRAAGPRRRDGAAAARLAGALSGDQGAGRAGRARRQPRRLRDRGAATALRLGQGRHDAAAGDGEDGRGRQIRLGRRRPQRHRHRPCRQRRRGPGSGRREGQAGRGLLHHRRQARRLPRLHHGAARDPGRRATRPEPAGLDRGADGARLRGRLEAPAATPANRR